jgi:hypothetical protein
MFTGVLSGQKNADPLNLSPKNHPTPVNIGETDSVDPLATPKRNDGGLAAPWRNDGGPIILSVCGWPGFVPRPRPFRRLPKRNREFMNRQADASRGAAVRKFCALKSARGIAMICAARPGSDGSICHGP